MDDVIKIGKHDVAITHPTKILFPQSGISKAELVAYYRKIAPYMLPHIKNRPLMMHRYVNGIAHEGFYQKEAGDYFPDYVAREPIKKQDGGIVNYVVCNNAAALMYIVNQLCITFHIWLSTIKKLQYPDRLIFDLDPSIKDFTAVRHAALLLKKLLEDELGLVTFVMTTGSRGLHVVVPLKPQLDFDEVRAFAKDVAQVLVNRHPKKLAIEMRKEQRSGKVFVDYLRNAFAQTGVAPYSVRAIEGAPIAMPILWDDVYSATLNPQKYTIKNVFRRLNRVGDAWADINAHRCSLGQAQKKLDKLL